MDIIQITADTWRLDVRIKRDGKQYRIREPFTGGRKAALARVHEIKKELADRAKEDTGSLTVGTFGEVLSFYLKRHTVAHSGHYFTRLKSDLGEVPLSHLRDRFDRWLMLMGETKTKDGRVFSPASLNRYTAWAKAAINYGIKRGTIRGPNPLLSFEKQRETPRDLPFSETDERNLLNAVDQRAPHLSALVRFALAVPVRVSEALAMQRGDVDLFNGCVRSRQGCMKGARMAATKPLPPDPLVQHHFRHLPADCEAVWYRTENGRNVPIRSFINAWRECVRAAGLPGFRFHDCRHVAVTRMLNAGTPAQVVAQIAGWTSTAMIRQYYKLDGAAALALVRFLPASGPERVHSGVLTQTASSASG